MTQKGKPRTQNGQNVPFLSFARFGPGSIILLSLLALFAILLFIFGLRYLAILPAVSAILIFAVKSLEVLQLGSPDDKNPIGKKCLVIKKVSSRERGLVRVYQKDGSLNPELWSAETTGHFEIEEGRTAKVVGMKSIVLLIERD
jgi:hypothetical protein